MRDIQRLVSSGNGRAAAVVVVVSMLPGAWRSLWTDGTTGD